MAEEKGEMVMNIIYLHNIQVTNQTLSRFRVYKVIGYGDNQK